jgi:hypothetical protein
MKNQAEKLMEKFADVSLLIGKEFKFNVYVIEVDNLNRNVFKTPYFTAQVNCELMPRGGYAIYQHVFQLDLASIKIELEKIDTDWAKNITTPQRIANVLNERYHEFTEYLIDYNGIKDNYAEIANLLYKYRGTSVATEFGI